MKKSTLFLLVLVVLYVVVANPIVTGVALHEWLAVLLFMVMVVHVAAQYVNVMTRVFRNGAPWSIRTYGRLALTVSLVVAFMTVMISGMGISASILSFFGLYADGYFFWKPLHAIAAKALLALVVIHVVVDGRSVVSRVVGHQNKKSMEKSAIEEKG